MKEENPKAGTAGVPRESGCIGKAGSKAADQVRILTSRLERVMS